MSRRFVVAAIGLVCSLVSNLAVAEEINVQFGNGGATYSGSAAAPNLGTVWNNLASANQSGTALVDSNGNPTGVTLSLSGASGGFTTGVLNPSAVDPSVPVGTAGAFDNLIRPQVFVAGNATATLTISGLTPGQRYNLYSYEIRGNTSEDTTFTVTSQAGSPSATSTPDNNTTTGFNSPEDYVLFTALVPSSGQIVETFTSGGATEFGATNGFQLLEITPEPSSIVAVLGLCGMSLIGFVRYRGRRKSARADGAAMQLSDRAAVVPTKSRGLISGRPITVCALVCVGLAVLSVNAQAALITAVFPTSQGQPVNLDASNEGFVKIGSNTGDPNQQVNTSAGVIGPITDVGTFSGVTETANSAPVLSIPIDGPVDQRPSWRQHAERQQFFAGQYRQGFFLHDRQQRARANRQRLCRPLRCAIDVDHRYDDERRFRHEQPIVSGQPVSRLCRDPAEQCRTNDDQLGRDWPGTNGGPTTRRSLPSPPPMPCPNRRVDRGHPRPRRDGPRRRGATTQHSVPCTSVVTS